MKKFYYLLILSVFSGIFLPSCQEEKKSAEDKYKGKWVLETFNPIGDAILNDSIDYFLSLNIGEDGPGFTTNSFPFYKEIKGSWSIKNDSLLFDYVMPNQEYNVSGMSIYNDTLGNSSVNLWIEGHRVGEIKDGQVNFIQDSHVAKIDKMTSNSLSFYLDSVGVYKFKREVIESGGFSFMSILRGILGIAFLLTLAFLFSMDRKSIDWSLVGKGIGFQILIALLVLKAPGVDIAFMWVSAKFVTLISYTNYGVDFLFGQMGVGTVQGPLITFAIKVLPTIVFFSALMSLLYYWGILQKIVYAFAWVMKKFMRLSGAESLAAAGNVFLGQTESPLLVKPYLLGMTKSEIMCLMTGGMATIAGGVLAAYIGFLGGDDPEAQAFFAKHLLTASIISAPAAIVAAKILVPETEKINEDLKISKDKIGVNALEAITNGTTDGLKLAVNVGAMLLVFIALMALANGILGWIGGFGANTWITENTSYEVLSFQFILGYLCAPIVWMMGIDSVDMVYVGELLGQKTILNEFVAYPRLGEMKEGGMLNEKSIIMSTYMLCGFANVASIGIQIGGIGALVPSRKGLLSQLGVRALVGGTIACMLTAAVVGMTL